MTSLTVRTQLVLSSLLSHTHGGSLDSKVLNGLPPEDAQSLLQREELPKGADPARLIADPDEILSTAHYSWIAEALSFFPESLHASFLAALPPTQAAGIRHLKNQSTKSEVVLAEPVRKYLCGLLVQRIEGATTILPLDFLPVMPLSPLLDFEKNLLLEIFDLLGLYDLADKVKRTVDKVQLMRINSCLSPAKQKFLRALIRQPDNVQLSELDLSNWSGDCAILKKMLHRRGLLRLGKALAGYPKDFIWHFVHRLDSGRGKIIMRYYVDEKIPISTFLADQILFIMNAINHES